jgi:hypothetical protein
LVLRRAPDAEHGGFAPARIDPHQPIEGPKAVGKTETAQRRAQTDYRLDGPAGQVVAANPRIVLGGESPDGIAIVPAALLGP